MNSKIYACADLHGRWDLWCKIKEYLGEHDRLIYLGDAIDRGKDSVKLAMELLKDPRVMYLMGNHEEMMNDFYSDEPNSQEQKIDWDTWKGNGGKVTRNQIARIKEPSTRRWFIHKIKNLPKVCWYYNRNNQLIYLSHSGSPSENKEKFWFTEDRDHYNTPVNKDYVVAVHGHTPVQIHPFGNGKHEMLRYCKDSKIDIDLGAVFTGKTMLLDLDTLEPIYFEEDE